jgi:flagellar basal-body rod modification protein FlgD
MTMSALGSTTSASAAATSSASSSTTAPVNTNEFLQLLVAQLQHQDPTQPTDGTQFVTQLAQFSQVEAAQNQTTQLTTISNQMTGLSSNEAASLIGKKVDVGGGTLAFGGTLAATTNVTLAGAASQVTVSVKDSSGNVVRTLKMGAESQGTLPITWDGKSDSGETEPAGTYTVSVNATDTNGAPVSVSSDVSGVVTKVSYDQGYPVVTLDNGATAAISQLVSVSNAPVTPTTAAAQ